jgi:hypothetical protein
MYGDFSRLTYFPGKAFTGVWYQQGRVQLDADANEQNAILLNWLRTLAVDFIGPFGGHVSRSGFGVRRDNDHDDLSFSPGHYYVYGLRCEVPRPAGRGAREVTYRGLVPGAGPLPDPPFIVELFVWERSVSAVIDPDLLEPALGPHPPDTTVRSQVAWIPEVSVRLPGPGPDGTPIEHLSRRDLRPARITARFEEHNADRGPRPSLAARVEPGVQTEEATIVPATSGYLGVENQLYRVEIHSGGTAGAGRPTFKWSRDNGSAEFRIEHIGGPEGKSSDPVTPVTVASLGRDARTGLEAGDWVELIDDSWAPRGRPGQLLEVRSVDRADRIVTLEGQIASDPSLHPCLRRWDQAEEGVSGPDGIPVRESSGGEDVWLDLEDGVQVRFPAHGAEYRRGDYWLIPARAATGRLIWPGGDSPLPLPPDGPARYLVPLAMVNAEGETEDLRSLFTHLAWPEPDDEEAESET